MSSEDKKIVADQERDAQWIALFTLLANLVFLGMGVVDWIIKPKLFRDFVGEHWWLAVLFILMLGSVFVFSIQRLVKAAKGKLAATTTQKILYIISAIISFLLLIILATDFFYNKVIPENDNPEIESSRQWRKNVECTREYILRQAEELGHEMLTATADQPFLQDQKIKRKHLLERVESQLEIKQLELWKNEMELSEGKKNKETFTIKFQSIQDEIKKLLGEINTNLQIC